MPDGVVYGEPRYRRPDAGTGLLAGVLELEGITRRRPPWSMRSTYGMARLAAHIYPRVALHSGARLKLRAALRSQIT